MDKFPKNPGAVYLEPSVINGNMDIYAHMEDGTCSILTIENRDLHGAINVFKFLGYKITAQYYGEEADYR